MHERKGKKKVGIIQEKSSNGVVAIAAFFIFY